MKNLVIMSLLIFFVNLFAANFDCQSLRNHSGEEVAKKTFDRFGKHFLYLKKDFEARLTEVPVSLEEYDAYEEGGIIK